MPALTIRERIMAEVERRLSTVVEGQPVDDPYLVEFGFVSRGAPLEEMHETARYGLAILDTDERVNPRIQQYVCQLVVVVEFLAWVDQVSGETPSTVANKVLGAIQRRMREDIHLTEPEGSPVLPELDRQLSENVQEVRSQLFIDGYADRKVSGASFWEITYKRGIADPRERVSHF